MILMINYDGINYDFYVSFNPHQVVISAFLNA